MTAWLNLVGGLVVAALVSGLGILMVISPVRWSRVLSWLARPQLDILRNGFLFDMYFPERVERSRSLRGQIRRLGVVFVATGILIVVQVMSDVPNLGH